MKTLGILGGMGPLATADLFEKIIRNTKADTDAQHIRVYIDNNPQIPDRTAFIMGSGADPRPEMNASARKLEAMGADILLMPCNTAHYFYAEVAGSVGIPTLHMIELAAAEAQSRGFARIALLATDGTLRTKLYEDALNKRGIMPILPREDEQAAVMDMIFRGIKKGDAEFSPHAFINAVHSMKDRGAQAFLLGCTELPIAFSRYSIQECALDASLVLARAAIAAAGYQTKE